MKTIACKSYYHTAVAPAYPNAATRRQILQKTVDTFLLAASGMGIGAILLLIMVL